MDAAPPPAPSAGRLVLLYSTLRLLLFLGIWLVLVLLGASALAGALVAAVLTSLLSLVLLKKQRDQVSTAILDRHERKRLEREELQRRLDQGPQNNGV
jgi:membrane peptidoglycan carboxypeptidase